jgi:hypothetical protein
LPGTTLNLSIPEIVVGATLPLNVVQSEESSMLVGNVVPGIGDAILTVLTENSLSQAFRSDVFNCSTYRLRKEIGRG